MLLYERPLRLELLGSRLHRDGEELPFSVRRASDLQPVLKDPSKMGPDGAAYYMFRNVYDHENLRFDITVLVPRMYGDEFNKTFGHTHPKAPSGIEYPEIYQVLRGEAFFVLQKRNPADDTYTCILVEGNEGEVLFIPPGYGHVSINRGNSNLVLSNVVSSSFESEYAEFRENRGAAFYYTEFGPVQNMNCIVKGFSKKPPQEILQQYRVPGGDLLRTMRDSPEKLEFLEKPEKLGEVKLS